MSLSGIVGIFNRSGEPVDPGLLRTLTGFLSYRAGDAVELWCDGFIGFGHAMLRTTQESRAERQPAGLNGKFWITADCRLDRRAELREALIKEGAKLSQVAPDSELILNAWVVWGDECTQRLAGDFSFAIWDRVRQTLYCVRDHFGIRPFYFAVFDDLLVFSNTLNCIRKHPALSSELNPSAIGDFLLFGLNCEASTTTFRDVQRLPAAHLLTASSKGIEIRRYWTIPTDGRIRYRREADYVEHFRSLLDSAVEDRMRSQPTGILLSGGLDSGTVAANARMTRERLSERIDLRAYTVTYGTLVPDHESELAGKLARYLDIPLRLLNMNSLRLFDGWDNPALMWPEPVEDPLSTGLYTQFSAVAGECRAVLSGEGSDNLMQFEMWPYAADTVRRGEWSSSCRQISSYLFLRGRHITVRKLVKRFFGNAQQPHFPPWIAIDFKRRMQLSDRWRSVQESWRGGTRHPIVPKAHGSFSLPHWTWLFEQSDPGVTRSPVQVLYPFLDLRIVNYVLALPPFPWFFEKHLLRETMRQRLPELIRCRSKVAMSSDPLLALLRSHPAEHRWAEANWTEEMSRYVDRRSLERPHGEMDSERARMNFRPYCLNFWLRSTLVDAYNS